MQGQAIADLQVKKQDVLVFSLAVGQVAVLPALLFFLRRCEFIPKLINLKTALGKRLIIFRLYPQLRQGQERGLPVDGFAVELRLKGISAPSIHL